MREYAVVTNGKYDFSLMAKNKTNAIKRALHLKNIKIVGVK